MEAFVYEDIIKQEKKHWWFKARREIIKNSILDLPIKSKADILEVGCGTGGNLEMLSSFGNIYAMEMESFAVEHAKKFYNNVEEGYLPNKIPFDKKFDLICMFDVLEHIEDDSAAIEALKEYLTEEGVLLITVPAYQWLYGTHDKFLHHKRRYSLSNLKKLFKDFNIIKESYFNTFLFPLVIFSRVIDKIKPNETSLGYETPSNSINNSLYTIFRLEKFLINKVKFPFGSSIILAVKKS